MELVSSKTHLYRGKVIEEKHSRKELKVAYFCTPIMFSDRELQNPIMKV